MLSNEELEQIPRRYRWFLKLFQRLPNPTIPYFFLKRLPEIEGIFWALIVPVVFVFYTVLFNAYFISWLSVHFAFPINIMIGLAIPGIIFVIFLRIQIERTIAWWRGLQNPTKEWDVVKAVEKFVTLTKEQRERKTKQEKSTT